MWKLGKLRKRKALEGKGKGSQRVRKEQGGDVKDSDGDAKITKEENV